MANENLKQQMVVKLGTTTNTEAQLISNMVDGALSGKGGDDPELENLKKQMVIKLGTTTNEDAQIISNMVDNAAGGGGGSIPSCDVTIVNTGTDAYELSTDPYNAMFCLSADNILEDGKTFTIGSNESLTMKFALVNTALLSPGEYVNAVGVGFLGETLFDTEDYSNVYTDLNNVSILIERDSPLSPSEPVKYYYLPVVIDITKPASCTFSADLNNLIV